MSLFMHQNFINLFFVLFHSIRFVSHYVFVVVDLALVVCVYRAAQEEVAPHTSSGEEFSGPVGTHFGSK